MGGWEVEEREVEREVGEDEEKERGVVDAGLELWLDLGVEEGCDTKDELDAGAVLEKRRVVVGVEETENVTLDVDWTLEDWTLEL